MAPNVKENLNQLDLSNHRLDALAKNLSSSLPKYLPLTHPSEAEQSTLVAPAKLQLQTEIKAPHIIENEEKEVESYWDWEQPTEAEAKAKLIEKILKEEECRQAVSTDRIVANLTSTARDSAARGKIIENEETEEAGYWDMPTENDVTDTEEASPVSLSQIEKLMIEEGARLRRLKVSEMVTAAHVKDSSHPLNSYWDWPSAPVTDEEKKAALLKQILEEEAIRVSLTVESIEHNLKQFVTDEKTTTLTTEDSSNYWYWADHKAFQEAPHTQDASHPNHEYWDFPSKPATDAERKAALLQQILKEESIRQMLSPDHIIENETVRSKNIPQEEEKTTIISNENVDDTYWNWNYLDETQTASYVKDLTHPMQNYWDERVEPVDEKAALIAKILEEESIRQSLMVERIESSIKSQASKRVEYCESSQEEKDSSYWDW